MTACLLRESQGKKHDGVSDNGSIQDDYGTCMKNQIYRGSSSQDVVCRCCGADHTSGSWRRGWYVRAIIDSDGGTVHISDRGGPIANLCNRCGQRWAKMGKCSNTEDIRAVMATFAYSTPSRSENAVSPLTLKRRRPLCLQSASPDDTTNKVGCSSDEYIGYAIKKTTGVKSSYALFWLLDKMRKYLLVVVGVDPRSSGHFVYQKSPLLPETIPGLRCTNRSETLKWIQENFHVTKTLAASLKANVPELNAHQVENILKASTSPKSPLFSQGCQHSGDKKDYQQTNKTQEQQHLCALCGCNHPSEECPTAVEASGAEVMILNQHRSEDQEIPDPFGSIVPIPADFDLGDEIPDLPEGISPIGDHIFASPKDYTPRSGEGLPVPQHYDNSPERLHVRMDLVEKVSTGIQTYSRSNVLLFQKTQDTEMDRILKNWTNVLEDFIIGQRLATPQYVVEILQQLLTYSRTLSLQQLSQSKILIPVSQLCTHGHPIISSTSRHLTDMWRSLAVETIHGTTTSDNDTRVHTND